MNRRTLLGATAALPFAGQALAQADFPSRSMTMVVAFPPGGQADLAARPIAAAMEKVLGQSVVVQNRGGAAGAIGNAHVARSAADGYTMLMALSSLAVIPEAEKLFGRTPPYTVEQFAPIALVNADPTMLAVPASAPWRTMEEFIAAAKANPGSIPYGSSGTYGTLHVAMEMLAAAAGFKALHVPFGGAGPAITALLGGQVQALASAPGTLTQHVRSGRVRVLGCWGRERVAAFPDVPTFMEKGFSEVEFYIWAGLFVPAATPAPVQARLREAVRRAAQDPVTVNAFNAAGAPVAYLDAPAFKTFFEQDSARLLRAVARIGKVE
ncbi:Bug family tripartite tricarboxylate transporter substrate binding protein [Falsiroseomonas selenitidurans]|uniref:Tripartite tricarboxylate transporter substrate binding protein n=1 Tax=Falsiroseomonas selenitidurans TaxID=2716335 RepID=A0ABX1E0S0_9PROT|nr:tripartite tricarboxylate transporter substrate binding protein [Falsiroseomonas selenitidurans]NKC30651.1 tripartite tricarboxylate transporter substrate binding protein [Falsiroseomonas selenitidurans]